MRKFAVTGAVCAGLFCCHFASAAEIGPTDQIASFDAALVAAMKLGDAGGLAKRTEVVTLVIDHVFDLPEMARLALGSAAKGLSPEQTALWVAAFRTYTIASYAGNFSQFNGEHFDMDGPRDGGRGAKVVPTRLVPGDGSQPVELDYVLHEVDGQWKVIDILADGAVSQMAARRTEFVTVLRTVGFDGLLAAVAKKTQAAVGKP